MAQLPSRVRLPLPSLGVIFGIVASASGGLGFFLGKEALCDPAASQSGRPIRHRLLVLGPGWTATDLRSGSPIGLVGFGRHDHREERLPGGLESLLDPNGRGRPRQPHVVPADAASHRVEHVDQRPAIFRCGNDDLIVPPVWSRSISRSSPRRRGRRHDVKAIT